MQIIDILSDDLNVEIFFQFGQAEMSGIGICLRHILAAHIIKIEHEPRILSPASGSSHFRYLIALPQPVGVPKSSQTAFGADAGACQYNQFFLMWARAHTKIS